MNAKTQTVARINGVSILVIENGEKRIAIKPICEALGVDAKAQRERIQSDPILSSVGGLSTSTGSDGKEYEMFTIPFEYVFGWLFRIDSRNVKESARESVLKYQVECYHALYNHFTAYADFVEKKQIAIEKQLKIVEEASQNFHTAKNVMNDARNELNKYRKLTFDDYNFEQRQLKIFTDDEMEETNN